LWRAARRELVGERRLAHLARAEHADDGELLEQQLEPVELRRAMDVIDHAMNHTTKSRSRDPRFRGESAAPLG
jgi:hypothetical protein